MYIVSSSVDSAMAAAQRSIAETTPRRRILVGFDGSVRIGVGMGIRLAAGPRSKQLIRDLRNWEIRDIVKPWQGPMRSTIRCSRTMISCPSLALVAFGTVYIEELKGGNESS